MKHYDLTLLINPDLEPAKANELWQKLLAFLQEHGALLDKSGEPSLTSLTYPVRKKVKAYLGWLTFYAKPEKLALLEQEIKNEVNFLRQLIFEKTIRQPSAKRRMPERKVEAKRLAPEDLDKKLEEILGA